MIYVLGNWLNGYHGGEFESQEEAWETLSKRSYLSFDYDRSVMMWVKEESKYGNMEWMRCQSGTTGTHEDLAEKEKKRLLEYCDYDTRHLML